MFTSLPRILLAAATLLVALLPQLALAHGVADGDRAFIEQSSGLQILPFIYLGAKHMVTGYDHLLFLFGVIFFLYRMKDIGVYVTLFAVGHSVTLLYGVLSGTHVNAYLVDAIIGLSVVYKAFDNLGGFRRLLGFQPNTRAAVLIFGFFHGFGLATKLQEFTFSEEGLVGNIVSFNVGVEIGQLLALSAILLAVSFWRQSGSYLRQAFAANTLLMGAGFILMGYQLTGYFVG
ncbi:MAG: HupE/UreJ family protein [Gammaproteobacteria bacterium]|uniref:HupE/UreJ family protein n=1 Tax=Pseudomaricurvus alcaniphilus TaxID=1166482 RepID=UPI00140D5E18|nr:HupE/UreJ family protein [Pseudomaricurvus alcaniphilus]MBR9908745.1 HupE/UreJ family protein [Gammaproteobacteria bacterium]NHN37841.1 HupE/UreJ family protein [Pseudomaricurvus alcaniphilus]